MLEKLNYLTTLVEFIGFFVKMLDNYCILIRKNWIDVRKNKLRI